MRWPTALLLLAACTSTPATDGDGSSSTAVNTDASVTGESTAAPDSSDSTGTTDSPNYEERGEYGVGVMREEIVGADDRTLQITIWYPTDTPDGEVALSQLVSGERADTLQGLVDAAPAECTRGTMDATLDAPLADGPFPAIVFSHCLSCLGFSSSYIAERVASHGAIVAGVTHTGDTLFGQLDGMVAPLNAAWLETRTLDVSATLDALLASDTFSATIDDTQIGVFGHSYGATTTGKVLQDDDRFVAGVAIAAPVENPLLPGVTTAGIDEPLLFLLAQEDNSITEVGNNFIRNNAMVMPGGSWLVELADAGHWSFSDLCGIVEAFDPGCGDGERQTVPGEAFTYLDASVARGIGASYVAAFFGLHLHGDAAAEAYLDTATPSETVTVTRY